MRRLPLVLVVFLLGAAPAAEADPSGRTLTVDNFGDSPKGAPSRHPGPPRSLRHVLMVDAKPGDTITFARPGEVALTAPIIIPADLHDIRIVGASGTGRAGLRDASAIPHWSTSTGAGFGLIVEANNVRIEGLTFTDTPLVFQSGNDVEFLRGGTIHKNLFNGRHGYLIVDRAVGAAVTENEFAGSQDTSISTSQTRGLRLVKNTVTTTRRTAVSDTTSLGLEVVDNVFERTSVSFDQSAGVIRGNTFKGGTFKASDWSSARAPGLTVERNTFEAAFAEVLGASKLLAVGNTHRGAPLRVSCFAANKALGAKRSIVATGNTLERAGIVVECGEEDMVRIEGNTVTRARTGILVAFGRSVSLEGNKLSGNGAGVTVNGPSTVRVSGGFARGNAGWGVAAAPNARVEVHAVAMGGNGGVGIDLAPIGRTPNGARKTSNDDQDWPTVLEYVKKDGKLRGKTCRGCRVEVYEAEEGDENGEGIRLLAAVKAGGDGRFVYPARGELECPETGKITVTATRPGRNPVTSEFSEDVECACVISSEFLVDGAVVPPTGFANFGVSFGFPRGAKVGEVTLTDTKTDKRPDEDDLGPQLQWRELKNDDVPGGAPGFFGNDFFVQVFYREGAAGNATGPRVVWKFRVAYERPPKAKKCVARFAGAPFLPPPRPK